MTSTDPGVPTETDIKSRRALIAILLLAAFLRLYRLDLISVTNASAFQELTAASALSFEGWDWPLAGPPTEDVRSSAFLVSAIAFVSVLWWHPFSGVVSLIALNLCAVALLFRLCARFFGQHVAIVSTLLYATAPWGILYARLLIPASCVAVFSVALIHVSLRWLNEKGKIQLFVIVLLTLIMPQVHFSGIIAPFWLIAVLYVGRQQLSPLSMIGGATLAAIMWMPWIEFQRITAWGELKTYFNQIFLMPSVHTQALLTSLQHLFNMLKSSNFAYWFGESPSDLPQAFSPWLWRSVAASGVVLLLLFLASVIRTMARTSDWHRRLLLLWVALSILVGGLLRTGRSPDNMLIACPILFVFVGLMTVRIRESLPSRIRILPMMAIVAFSIVHVASLADLVRYVDEVRETSAGQYQFSYRQRQTTIRSVLADAGNGPVRLVGEFSGWYPAYQYVLSYEPTGRNNRPTPTDEPVCYWIDELLPTVGDSETAWRDQKERRINLSVAESLRTSPDWVIERHWSVGEAQIYRIRLLRQQPFH